MKNRTYSELIKLSTFEERFQYLKLNGTVGEDTFGSARVHNQMFYMSNEWKKIRDKVIIRDNGCDLGISDCIIFGPIIVHHMNPITLEDLFERPEYVLNPEYLISVSQQTHNAIHFGNETILSRKLTERKPNDTCPWR